jgi:MarR-like DNA-binding transcriptional regulator SgrR of sgrS sRNA
MTVLEPIASTLVSDRWIIPLFHHKQTLNFADQLQGVSMTIWGWPDIKSVWVEE